MERDIEKAFYRHCHSKCFIFSTVENGWAMRRSNVVATFGAKSCDLWRRINHTQPMRDPLKRGLVERESKLLPKMLDNSELSIRLDGILV